jgi:hypothetical protein
VHLVARDDRQSFAKRSKFRHVIRARLDRQDHQDRMDRPEIPADLEDQDDQETTARPAHRDRTAHQDPLVHQATTVHPVNQDDRLKARQAFPANLDLQVILEHRDQQATMAHRDAMANLEDPARTVHQAHQAHQAKMAHPDSRAPLVSRVRRANVVFVRSTAPWMAASSSKMAPDAKMAANLSLLSVIIVNRRRVRRHYCTTAATINNCVASSSGAIHLWFFF